MNPMKEAWIFLKGNPDMTDSEGRTVPPAAMNYAQQARALEDSLQHGEDDYTKRGGAIAMDMREDENAANFFEKVKDRRPEYSGGKPFAEGTLNRETMQQHADFARERAKRDTSMYMREGEGHNQFGKDPHIQRMPR